MKKSKDCDVKKKKQKGTFVFQWHMMILKNQKLLLDGVLALSQKTL